MLWITDCGWITTSSCSTGRRNRWWASMISRPLFISVAESTDILAPIRQFGWATASGQDDLLDRLGALEIETLPDRAVFAVDRQQRRAMRRDLLHEQHAGAD